MLSVMRSGTRRKVLCSLVKALPLSLLLLLLVSPPRPVLALESTSVPDQHPPIEPRPIDEGFTMIIASYKRDEILHQLLSYLVTSPPPSLRHLVVVWQNVGQPLPTFLQPSSLSSFTSTRLDVLVRLSSRNSMNERFRPLLDWDVEIPTEDVMILDDDLVLPTTTIEWGYQRFREHSGRIVGFTGRDYTASSVEEGDEDGVNGGLIEYVAQPTRTYSMVLSNAAWMKTAWLRKYWEDTEEMRGLRSYVDEVFNCDDLLINFLVSNITHFAPLLLKPIVPLRTIPSPGLWNRDLSDSNQLDHFSTRSQCLSYYFDQFSRYDPDPPSSKGRHRSYWPLKRCDYSISKSIEDEARELGVSESWDEPSWAVEEWEKEEEDGRTSLREVLDGMSDEEIEEYFRNMSEQEQEERDEDEEWEARGHDEL